MPRVSPHYVPAYRLHKSSGQAIVTLSGRDHLLGEFGTTSSRAKYHELVARWITGGRKPLHIAAAQPHPMFSQPQSMSVADLINAHLRHALAYYVDEHGNPTTEVRNYESATTPLADLFGPTPADQFTPSKLKLVRSRMIAKGWARTHVNKNISRVRSLWSWGTEEELVSATVYQALRAVKGLKAGRTEAAETEPIRPVPPAHIDAIRKFVASPVWAMVELQRLSGARSGEMVRLRAIDIDTTGTVWIHTPKQHKTAHFGHKRIIYFGPRAIAVLRPFMKSRPVNAFLFSPREANAERKAARSTKGKPRRENQKPNPPKSKRKVRERYDPEGYRKAIARACVLANVPHWHPHQLRHNAATEWRKTYGPDVALTLLGDKSTRMVDIYAEKDHQAALRVVAEVG